MKNFRKVLSLSLAAISLSVSSTALAMPDDTIIIGDKAYELLALDSDNIELQDEITDAVSNTNIIYYNMSGTTNGFIDIFDGSQMSESVQSTLNNIVLTKANGSQEVFTNFDDDEGVEVANEKEIIIKDVVAKICDIDIDDNLISLVFEDPTGRENTYDVELNSTAYYALDRNYKKLAEKENISEDLAKTMLLQEDDIVKISYTESNRLIKSIEGFITEDSMNSSYKIYRLLEITDSGEFVLGFDNNGAISKTKDSDGSLVYADEDDYYDYLYDMTKNDYEHINGVQTLNVAKSVSDFNILYDSFVMVHLNDDENIDAVVRFDLDDTADDFDVEDFSTSKIGKK